MGAGTQGAYCNPPWGYSEDRAAVLMYPTLPDPTLPQCTHAYERSGAQADGDRPTCPTVPEAMGLGSNVSKYSAMSFPKDSRNVCSVCCAYVAGRAAARLPRHPCYRAGYVACEPTAPPGTAATYSASCTLAGHRGIRDSACSRTQSGIDPTRY